MNVMNGLDVVNIKITNGCNLSCKGCSHMSQYATASSSIDVDKLKQDIIAFRQNFNVLHHVSLLGGEVLLEPRWSEVLSLIEDLYLGSVQVRFYTNGLLLDKNKEAVVQHMLRGSKLRISLHESPESKVGQQVMKQVALFLEYANKHIENLPSLDVLYSHGRNNLWDIPDKIAASNNYNTYWTELFYEQGGKLYPYNSDNIELSYQHCPCRNAQLYNGRVLKCQTAYLRDTLAAFEQLDDPAWQPYLQYKGISLHASDEEKAQFYFDQQRPMDFCSMCPKNGHYSVHAQDFGKKRHIKVIPV